MVPSLLSLLKINQRGMPNAGLSIPKLFVCVFLCKENRF